MNSSATHPEAPPTPSAQRPLKVTAFGMTHVGRQRSSNEDQFLIAALTKAMEVQQTSLPQPKVRYSHEQGHLFLVADGMGGHAGGEHASALAIQAIENFTLNSLKWFFHLQGDEKEVLAEFQAALSQADASVFAEASRHPKLKGMGTTVTMAYSIDQDLFVVHAGDSRCYLFRAGKLYRLTQDHTIVQEMVSKGVLEPEQAAHHQLRHIITNVVGGDRPGVRVEVHKAILEVGDKVLLCSDGLTEMVPETELAQVLQEEDEPPKACQRLIDRANELGGKDNVTVIVGRYEAAKA